MIYLKSGFPHKNGVLDLRIWLKLREFGQRKNFHKMRILARISFQFLFAKA